MEKIKFIGCSDVCDINFYPFFYPITVEGKFVPYEYTIHGTYIEINRYTGTLQANSDLFTSEMNKINEQIQTLWQSCAVDLVIKSTGLVDATVLSCLRLARLYMKIISRVVCPQSLD